MKKKSTSRTKKYISKAKLILKEEGVLSLAQMAAGFGIRHTPLHKLFPGQPVYHINPHDVAKWYKRYSKSVTIVIPSYNDIPLLKKCIRSIEDTTEFKKVKVVIVDDYCQEENSAKLKKLESSSVKVIFRKKNGGFAKAVNTGMRSVKSGDIIVLNSDTIAKHGWIQSLQFAVYKYDRKIGIAGPKLIYKNGLIQSAGSFHHRELQEWFDHYYKMKPENTPTANVPEHVIGVTGACMYIKREVIDKIGYFDEKFGMAFEDMDYCLRAWKAGFRSFYVPTAKLIHLESATRGKEQGEREIQSQKYFWSKWHDFFYKRNVTAKNGKLRILYVLNDTGLAGGIRMVFDHLNRLQERGHDVELYSLGKDPTWFDLKVPHRSFKSYEELCEKLAKQDAIKVATWWETGKWVWLGSITKGIPVFYVQDVEDSYYKDDKVMQSTVIAGYKPEFNYLTISVNNQENLAKMGRKATNITCGIDAKTFNVIKNTTRDDNTLLAIGRKHYLKNFAMTFKAWKNMKDKPKMVLFGFEPDVVKKDPLITYHYIPTDEQINVLMNKTTVFVQSSVHEGFCLPPLEAMAAGLPVIMTDSNGNRDFMKPGKNCILVEQKNDKQLTRELERLLKDKALQERLRTNGLKTAAEYDWPVIIDKLEKFYYGLANEAKKDKPKTSVI